MEKTKKRERRKQTRNNRLIRFSKIIELFLKKRKASKTKETTKIDNEKEDKEKEPRKTEI